LRAACHVRVGRCSGSFGWTGSRVHEACGCLGPDHNGAAMSTRMLILLAALCAVAILAASAIQILIAR
jgi:hypothetical protein